MSRPSPSRAEALPRETHRYPWRQVVCLLLLAYGPMFLWRCSPVTGLGGWSTPGIEFFLFLSAVGLLQVLLCGPLCLFARWRERARVCVHTGAWFVLVASVPSAFFSFDEFVYLPNQRYPEHEWGGWWERLGRWAYLHE